MYVAQPLDVGEDLIGAGAADGAGGLEGVADQHDAGLEVAGVEIEIAGADFHLAEIANSPVMRLSRGSETCSVSTGARRIWPSQGSSISR